MGSVLDKFVASAIIKGTEETGQIECLEYSDIEVEILILTMR